MMNGKLSKVPILLTNCRIQKNSWVCDLTGHARSCHPRTGWIHPSESHLVSPGVSIGFGEVAPTCWVTWPDSARCVEASGRNMSVPKIHLLMGGDSVFSHWHNLVILTNGGKKKKYIYICVYIYMCVSQPRFMDIGGRLPKSNNDSW